MKMLIICCLFVCLSSGSTDVAKFDIDCTGFANGNVKRWCTVTVWTAKLIQTGYNVIRHLWDSSGTIGVYGRTMYYETEGGWYRWKWRYDCHITDVATGLKGSGHHTKSKDGALEEAISDITARLNRIGIFNHAKKRKRKGRRKNIVNCNRKSKDRKWNSKCS